MAFKDLNAAKRIIAVHIDIMKHKEFTRLGGVTQIGEVHTDKCPVPTAATNGCDTWYDPTFVLKQTRKQLRYLVCHENLHKGLHHCTDYIAVSKKYPEESGQAADYVVNGLIEELDPTFEFVERPTEVPPLVDPQYANMSFMEVLSKLLKKNGKGGKKPHPQPQPGSGAGKTLDLHIQREPEEGEGDPAEGDGEGAGDKPAPGPSGEKLKQQIIDAMAQGEIAANRMRGEGKGGINLNGYKERDTDWRTPLRAFVQEVCEGDDYSRFSPPNKRFMPLGILMPSHFSESMAELIVACDTSGSMHGLYPTVFGEVGRICQSVIPESLRVIWWGDGIEGEQVFLPKDYDKIKDVLAPKGGGGTTVSCLAQHFRKMKYKPKATILLSDGYVESQYEVVPGPVLWGIVDNPAFVPIRGKVIHIISAGEGV